MSDDLTERQRELLEELKDLCEEETGEVYGYERRTVEALIRKGLIELVGGWERSGGGNWRADARPTSKGWST